MAAQITALLLLFISVCPTAHPHSDLQLQIDELTVQLEHEPGNVDLLLRRGDLQRRHENWDLARTDFKRVREIQPENETVDWFEGRLEVQSGHPSEGVRYLDRFLLTNPLQPIALQNRAQGYLLLDQPVLAAKDLQVVIRESDKPAPSIYSACALAFVEAGPGYFPAAMDVVLKGLLIFPTEIMLTGIATDLSLAQSDTETARVCSLNYLTLFSSCHNGKPGSRCWIARKARRQVPHKGLPRPWKSRQNHETHRICYPRNGWPGLPVSQALKIARLLLLRF